MKICCISDTHNFNLDFVPEADVLLHAGDFTQQGTLPEIAKFNEYCKQVKHRFTYGIYATPGNHDFLCQTDTVLCKSILTDCKLLIDEAIEIDKLNFYFSPWQPWFFDWAFNFREQDLDQARACWAAIPDDTNVLITHGPPRKILDRTPDRYDHLGKNVGCGPLFSRVNTLQNLLLHVFGHIHYSYGYEKFNEKHFINASICTEQYRPTNPPYVVDIDTVYSQVVRIDNGN
jgi:Icc-related predicted phosphoesterase